MKEKGIRDAERVARHYREKAKSVDGIYCSPAIRALHTAQRVSRTWEWDWERFHIREEIYDFGGDRLLEFIRKLDNILNHVVVVGHNEALTVLVNQLGSQGLDNLPTAGLAEIEFPVEDWNQVGKGVTTLMLIPGQLKDL